MAELDHDPLEGSPKYKVLRELGRGGMGEVFLAEHTALGNQVVVKLLHAELSARSALVDRMRLEAQALARLNHTNIVRVTDFDRTPSGRPYFVMEFLPGHSLGQELEARGGLLPPLEAISVVRQALAGLGAAHAKGLVHRDVKLDNLFVAETQGNDGAIERVIKILDFGVAKLLDPTADGPAPLMVPTGTGVVVGTPRFFAPEQARGHKLDHRADIYAMGLVLYSLLAGRGPFDEARSITEMAKAHVLTPPEPPSRYAPQPIPRELDAVVLRAIQKRPEDRFQSTAEFSAELDRVARTMHATSSTTGHPATPATHYETPAVAHAPMAHAPMPMAAPPPAGVAATAPPRSMSDLETARFAAHPSPGHVPTAPFTVMSPASPPGYPAAPVAPGPRLYPPYIVVAWVVGASIVGAVLAAVLMFLPW